MASTSQFVKTLIATVFVFTFAKTHALPTVNFSSQKSGTPYCRKNAEQDFGKIVFKNPDCDRAAITSIGGDNKLRITYPANKFGSTNGGVQFKARVEPARSYELTYTLRFRSGFEFVKGGKLPGMCGGECYTGGKAAQAKKNCDGWSARYMWRAGGKAVVYLYYCGSKEPKFGELIEFKDSGKQVLFKTETNYTLKQRITLNSGRSTNGLLQVWLNGKMVVNRKDILYANEGSAQINTFYFSTFYGGGSQDWAPGRTTQAEFDNIAISKL